MSVWNLMPGAVGQGRQRIIYGQIAPNNPQCPLPTHFTDQLHVIQPDWDMEKFWTVASWPQCHGSTLPAAGADCLLIEDSRGALRCVWWSAAGASFAPTGAAGGDLSGTFPNPTVAKLQGNAVSSTAPTSNQGLVWNGSAWAPANTVIDSAASPKQINSTSVANGDVLTYDSTAGKYVPGSQATSGLSKVLQLLSAQKSQSFTGQQLTWPAAGAFSNATTLSLSGATGNVFAVVAGGNITNPAFFDVPVFTAVPNGSGGVAIAAKTAGGAAPGAAGVCTFQALVWGS